MIKSGRKSWHKTASKPVSWWMLALIIAGASHILIPEYRWMLIHMLTLGILSNSIHLWSFHFTEKWMHADFSQSQRRSFVARVYALNVAFIITILGRVLGQSWLVVLGASAIAALFGCHAIVLGRQFRPSQRFAHSIVAYVASAISLVAGAILGGLLGLGYSELLPAHLLLNFGGFVGLAALGSLAVLFPAMWRTQIKWDFTRWSVGIAIVGLVVGTLWLTPGLLIYAAAWLLALVGFLSSLVAVARDPRDRVTFASVSALAAILWLIGSILALAAGHLPVLGLAVGFAAQLLIGTMSYLLPTTIGGGPAATRAGMRVMNQAGLFRCTLVNGGLLIWIFSSNSWLKVVASALVCLSLAYLVPATPWAVKAQRTLMAHKDKPLATPDTAPRWHQITAGIAVLTAAAMLLSGNPGPQPASTAAGAETVRMDITMNQMRFHPSSITVPANSRLVLTLKNEDSMVHDLVFPNGATTGRLNPGETAELDAGVITESTQAWCSIAGHRMQGMTLDVLTGTAPAEQQGQQQPHQQHQHQAMAAAGVGKPPAHTIDPVVPPSTVHDITINVEEKVIDGRARWTFNGDMQGPTLRGKIGDEFRVKFVNNGSMPHSIDFHAGLISPDEPMKSINPGESLQYNFRAHHSGIWLYHCGTMPMSMHIAAGMFGAVIIDPPDLAPVDHEYLIIQSELYGSTNDPTNPVDATKLAAGTPDRVMFNSVEDQYVRNPLHMRAGETARFWLLDAGPNNSLSFHIVGSQFHTSYKEGAYLLKDSDTGASQALDLLAAQGGFVEARFPEPGTYTMVNHQFIDAERGARGKIIVE
ncbi:cupredoxin domain-containing protein [Corynebacterium sp. H127]|uniref:cupredoxin domain-containing protein n=1 Tax=Corynebacterium sp. H127 TaxID=3133418 RepID=UPI0030B7507B